MGEVEEWVDEPVEVIKEELVTEERIMPTVTARYQFQGQGMTMIKGEEMFLLTKTNNDWWNVRKISGEEGFVPANYVKEGPQKRLQLELRNQLRLRETQREKRNE